MNEMRYGNELEMRRVRSRNRHDTYSNGFQTATAGSDPCRRFKPSRNYLLATRALSCRWMLPILVRTSCGSFTPLI
jgi:hypothetical protein